MKLAATAGSRHWEHRATVDTEASRWQHKLDLYSLNVHNDYE